VKLGTQYYRPPFPEQKYWEEDFARIKDSGLNTVQLWLLWAWVESKPREFIFDDYDRLIELAERNGLGVILSTIAEIQPYWISRVVPGSELIDHMGRKVISSNRGECNFGLTPGSCTDHPDVWDRMKNFLTGVVTRYRSASNLRGWDAWNELRWNVQSDGLVCFCPYTLAAFRNWLDRKYDGLEGLNNAWKRRYGCWEEVMPGKLPGRPYTEMMAFQHFITWRANQHGKNRYDLMKSLDPDHPITVHACFPSPQAGGDSNNHAINRGNDWFFADNLDGVGCSSFPKWWGQDDIGFSIRVDSIKSAARNKLIWLSEVQGGRSSIGFDMFKPVDAPSQQRWIWNGIACGADAVLFWCWRDEVFGMESSGFGLSGNDGLAPERLAAMKVTGRLIEEYDDIISGYKPEEPEVGVMFSPQSYYLYWAQEGNASRPVQALKGYTRSLVRKSIPYSIVEEEHLDVLSELKILFLPRIIVTDSTTEKALEDFVKEGGTLVCESECGAFNPQGFYRYPEERFISRLSGIHEVGRRSLSDDCFTARIDSNELNLGVTQWLTPYQKGKGQVLANEEEGILMVEVPVGKGKLILCGAYLGDAYLHTWRADFENFLELMVRRAGWQPEIEILSPHLTKDSFIYIKSGQSGEKRVVFIFFPPDHDKVHLRFKANFFSGMRAMDIISGKEVNFLVSRSGQECTLTAPEWRFSVLVGH